jgi:hypothetical protein
MTTPAGEWYYARDNQQHGPVTADAVRLMLAEGQINHSTLVWREGLAQWSALRAQPEFAIRQAMPIESSTSTAATSFPPAEQETVPLAYSQRQIGEPPVFSALAMDLLSRTSPWVRFISIMLFIGAAFTLLGGLGMVLVAVATEPSMLFLALFYVICGAFYGVPAYLLWRYADRIAAATRTGRSDTVEAAIDAQRAFWKTAGILVLVFIGLSILFVILIVFVGAVGGF